MVGIIHTTNRHRARCATCGCSIRTDVAQDHDAATAIPAKASRRYPTVASATTTTTGVSRTVCDRNGGISSVTTTAQAARAANAARARTHATAATATEITRITKTSCMSPGNIQAIATAPPLQTRGGPAGRHRTTTATGNVSVTSGTATSIALAGDTSTANHVFHRR